VTDLLARAAGWLNARLRLGPQPRWPLDCGCPDDGPRFVRDCGHTACEQHRLDPHTHEGDRHA